jgi:hydroxymethylpyrimidine/phosphomethylpyrimidine kinase
VHIAPVATTVGFTTPGGGWRGAALPEAAVRRQLEGARDAVALDVVRIGLVGSEAGARAIAEMLPPLPVVVDPAFLDRAGEARLADDAVGALLARLVPLATVIMPNADEASRLTGRPVRSLGGMRDAARRLADFGVGNVLITGGRLQDHAVDLLWDGAGFIEFGCDRRPDGHLLRGVGETFTAAVAGHLARGLALPEAIDAAKALVTRAIDAASSPGPGHRAVEPLAEAYEALSLDPNPIEVPESEGGPT